MKPNLPTLGHTSSDGLWAGLVSDLDRCEHGRHSGDVCGSCGGRSHGNWRLRTGTVIGHDRHGNHLMVPEPDRRHDPAAWRPQTAEEQQ